MIEWWRNWLVKSPPPFPSQTYTPPPHPIVLIAWQLSNMSLSLNKSITGEIYLFPFFVGRGDLCFKMSTQISGGRIAKVSNLFYIFCITFIFFCTKSVIYDSLKDKISDKKKQKASAKFYEDVALIGLILAMALLCQYLQCDYWPTRKFNKQKEDNSSCYIPNRKAYLSVIFITVLY